MDADPLAVLPGPKRALHPVEASRFARQQMLVARDHVLLVASGADLAHALLEAQGVVWILVRRGGDDGVGGVVQLWVLVEVVGEGIAAIISLLKALGIIAVQLVDVVQLVVHGWAFFLEQSDPREIFFFATS